MEVQINEVRTDVRAVDGESLLTPAVLLRIVNAVVEVMEDREERRDRETRETRVTPGVSRELMEA